MKRVFRSVDDPNHVFVFLEFASVEDAQESRRRLLESGVLDRFEDKHGPNVVEEAAAPAQLYVPGTCETRLIGGRPPSELCGRCRLYQRR